MAGEPDGFEFWAVRGRGWPDHAADILRGGSAIGEPVAMLWWLVLGERVTLVGLVGLRGRYRAISLRGCPSRCEEPRHDQRAGDDADPDDSEPVRDGLPERGQYEQCADQQPDLTNREGAPA